MRALVSILVLLSFAPRAADAATWVVRPGESIQAAVDAAVSGDTILVRPGSYGGNGGAALVHVRTSGLTLRGSASAVLDASGYRHGVLVGEQPRAGAEPCPEPSVRGFELVGFTVRGAGESALRLEGVDGFSLRDGVYLDNARHGASLVCAAHGAIGNGYLAGHGAAAIEVAASSHVTVEETSVTASVIGIAIENSTHVLVRRNQVFGNGAGVAIAVQPQRPVPHTDRVRIEDNAIIENNLARPATPGVATFVTTLPSGVGILNAGGDHVAIERNVVLGNDSFGVAALASPLAHLDSRSDSFVDAQSVQRNVILMNGHDPDPLRAAVPGADIVFVPDRIDFQSGAIVEPDPDPSDNCYGENRFFTDSPMEVTGSLACP